MALSEEQYRYFHGKASQRLAEVSKQSSFYGGLEIETNPSFWDNISNNFSAHWNSFIFELSSTIVNNAEYPSNFLLNFGIEALAKVIYFFAETIPNLFSKDADNIGENDVDSDGYTYFT
ncbi:MAG: hypothetical protein H0U73_12975 [Tatlockia sp.]|nr:hypothetical protein [Tatlockia sp.]